MFGLVHEYDMVQRNSSIKIQFNDSVEVQFNERIETDLRVKHDKTHFHE